MVHGVTVNWVYLIVAFGFALVAGVGTIFYTYAIVIPEVEGHRSYITNVATPKRQALLSKIFNWEIYEDKRFRFEMRYPSGWHVKKEERGVVISQTEAVQKGDPQLWVYVLDNPIGKDVRNIERYEYVNFDRQCATILFFGNPAFNCKSLVDFTQGHQIIFYKGNRIFEIQDSIQNDTSDTMISTFEFKN